MHMTPPTQNVRSVPRAVVGRLLRGFRRRRRILGWCWLVLLLSTATADASQGRRTFEEPRFFIEDIRVEGAVRTAPELIISESLLMVQQEYDESELLEAVYRIQRLPFIFDARFALDRGSERGKLHLVISVKEVARFFFGGESKTTAFARDLTLDRTLADNANTDLDVVGGMRFFMGTYGVFFAAVSSGESVQLGLTRYQVFGRRVFVSLGLSRQGCCPVTVRPLGLDPTFSSWSSDVDSTRGNFTLGIPLRGNHSLRFDASRFQSSAGSRRLVLDPAAAGTLNIHQDMVDQRVEVAWLYDTSDDPNFPTRGHSLSVAYELREVRADFPITGLAGDIQVEGTDNTLSNDEFVIMRTQMHRLVAVGSQHWPLTRRQTLSASLRLSVGRSDLTNVPLDGLRVLSGDDLDVLEANLTLRHSVSVWRSQRDLSYQELRWENVAQVGHEETSPNLGLLNNPLDRWSFHTSLVYRSTWGLFRFGLAVEDVGRNL